MPDAKSNASRMLEQDAQTTGRQLGEPEPVQNSAIDDMSDDEIREHLRARGLEVRRLGEPHGVIAKEGAVRGKTRVGLYLSTPIRKALKYASYAANRSESVIIEEALTTWLNTNNMRI